MVPEICEGYSTAVLGGIENVLLLSGFFYFVVSHRHRVELLREYPSLLLSRAVEGIIAVDSALEEDLPIPVVAVSDHHHRPSVINIELDHLLAGALCSRTSQSPAPSRDSLHQRSNLQLRHAGPLARHLQSSCRTRNRNQSAPGNTTRRPGPGNRARPCRNRQAAGARRAFHRNLCLQ